MVLVARDGGGAESLKPNPDNNISSMGIAEENLRSAIFLSGQLVEELFPPFARGKVPWHRFSNLLRFHTQ